MSTEEMDTMHQLAAPYAVDALDAAEQEEFEAHLSACPACQTLVSELREASVHLSEGLELSPPADLRARVLAEIGDEGATPLRGRRGRGGSTARRPGRRTWLAAAAAAAVIAGAAVVGTQVLAPDEVDQVLQAADAQEYTADGEEGQTTVVTSMERDAAALHLPSGMTEPEAGSVYQAWFVHADGTARSAGVLGAEALGEDGIVLEGSPEGAVAVGLSVEPAGGSQQPTTEPFAVVPLD